jgi:hypothetical protein
LGEPKIRLSKKEEIKMLSPAQLQALYNKTKPTVYKNLLLGAPKASFISRVNNLLRIYEFTHSAGSMSATGLFTVDLVCVPDVKGVYYTILVVAAGSTIAKPVNELTVRGAMEKLEAAIGVNQAEVTDPIFDGVLRESEAIQMYSVYLVILGLIQSGV